MVRGAKYVFETRSSRAVELVPPEKPITSDPTALRALRLGPSGIPFIEGSRTLRNRVCMSRKKQDLKKHFNELQYDRQ